jgi:tetratricopeptide (TPR) repeat protein
VRTHILKEGNLFLGSDDGRVLAYSSSEGELLWEHTFSSDEDPIRSELVVAEDLLLTGTYYGQAIALRVAAPPHELETPKAYLDREEYEAAAAAFALSGDLRSAAEIFAQKVQGFDKAFALYEHAGLFQEAGELARSQGMHSQAREHFRKAGDLLAEAEMDLKMGDDLGAAKKYEQAGELKEAARLYEQAGELRAALDLHKRLRAVPDILRLVSQVIFTPGDIEYLEKEGRLKEAGNAAVKAGALEKAAKLFKEAGEGEREWGVLVQLTRKRPEEWVWERLAKLSRGRGEFRQEAEAWENLKRSQKAAEAYQFAARQMEQVDPSNEAAIAALYERAAVSFGEAGVEADEKLCQAKVVHYRRLPLIKVKGHTNQAFKEEEWNMLELVVQNVGRGVALHVRVRVGEGLFDVDETTGTLAIRRLAAETDKTIRVYARPKEREFGSAVPLRLDWSWESREGQRFDGFVSTHVPVLRRDESRPGGTPQVVYIGKVVHGNEISGDLIEGDQIGGDKVETGAQKGDRVEIQRGESVRLHGEGLDSQGAKEPPEPTVPCPNCHLPVLQEENFCQVCGVKLPGGEKREMES